MPLMAASIAGYAPLHLLQAAMALAVLAGGTAYAQRWALNYRSRRRWAIAWVLGTAAIAAMLVFSAVSTGELLALFGRPGIGADDLAGLVLRINVLTCLMATALVPAMAWWDRLGTFGVLDAGRAAARLSVPALAALLLLGLFVDTVPAGDPASPPPTAAAADPWLWPLALALFGVVAVNAAGWARALAQRGLDRLAGVLTAIVPTVLAAGVALLLFQVIAARVNLPDAAAHRLLGAEATAGAGTVAARWLAAYAAAVVLMGVSGAVGLRLGAAPREPMEPLHLPHAAGESSELPLADATTRAVGALLARGMDPLLGHPLAGAPRPPTSFPQRQDLRVVLVVAAMLALYVALVPFDYQGLTLAALLARYRSAAGVAGQSLGAGWLGQLLLFVPLGFLGLGAATLDRRSRWPLALAVPALAGGLALWALLIEFAQLWFPPRRASLLDALAATVAALIGMAAWLLVGQRLVDRLRRALSEIETARGRRLLLRLVAAVLLLYALVPLELRHSLPVWRSDDGHASVTALRWLRDLLAFVPLGVLLAKGWERGGATRPRSILRVAGWSALAALLVAALRRGLDPDGSFVAAVGAMTAGGLAGAALARRCVVDDATLILGWAMRFRPRLGCAIGFCALYGAAVTVLLWSPFGFSGDPVVFNEQIQRLAAPPLASYYRLGVPATLLTLAHYVFIFLPVGVALRWAAGEHLLRPILGWALVAAFALAVGAVVEIGQAAIAPVPVDVVGAAEPRAAGGAPAWGQGYGESPPGWVLGPVPEVTDLLAYLAGALAGWGVTGLFLSRDH